MNYADFAAQPRSEKVTLAIVEAATQYKLFAAVGGGIYSRSVKHWVGSVHHDGVALSESTHAVLNEGEWFFDAPNLLLFICLDGGINPKTEEIVVRHKFFFSDIPCTLPFDLNEGEEVEFDARIDSVGSLGQTLDDQNTGIVLESSSNIKLHNMDGFFDRLYDTLIWENQNIEFFSWSSSIPVTESRRLFKGIIESKSFASDKASFNVKDLVYKLRGKVNLPLFSDADGTIAPSLVGTPKRRIYGQVERLQCVGLSNVLSGYSITGTVSVVFDSLTMAGVGTKFLEELSPDDELFIVNGEGDAIKYDVESIESDTSLTLGKKSEFNISGVPATLKPSNFWQKKNRRWHIAGHKLRSPQTTITVINSNSRITVANTDDLYPDDLIRINDEFINIRRITTGNRLVLRQALAPLPAVGDLVVKNPVYQVFYGDREMFIDRDWTLVNGPEAILSFTETAEFNIANQKTVGVNLAFTNGSRSVTTSATTDLRNVLKSRDWIKKNEISDPTWYEVLSVKEQQILLRTPYSGSSTTVSALMKNVDGIKDDALITVNCYGAEDDSGKWVKRPADAVRHLILNDAGFDEVNEESFEKSKAMGDYILSMVIPQEVGQEAPTVKDTITKINESCFGSLYGNSSMLLSYSILNATKPESIHSLYDHDVLDWSISSEQKIVSSVKVNYRQFTDVFIGGLGFKSVVFNSDFVRSMMGIQNEIEKTIYLYEDDKALIMAHRWAFFQSLSNSKLSVKGKLNLATLSVNDKLYLRFDRLYDRYGGNGRDKIGIVSGIKKNGLDTELEIIDVGNVFNRVPCIAPTGTPSYQDASQDELIRYGFIVDNDTKTPDPDSEMDLGNNLLG